MSHPHPFSWFCAFLLQVADLAAVVGGLVVASLCWSGRPIGTDDLALVGLLVAAVSTLFHAVGAYEGRRDSDARACAVFGLIVAGFAASAAMMQPISRLSLAEVLTWGVCTLLAMAIARCAGRMVRRALQRRGIAAEAVLLVGRADHCARFAERLAERGELGLDCRGFVCDAGEDARIVGRIDELDRLVDSHGAAGVVVCAPLLSEEPLLARVYESLHTRAALVYYAPDLAGLDRFPVAVRGHGDVALFDLSASPLSGAAWLVKWFEDKLLGLAILTLITPVLLVVAALVKLTSPGPALFVQPRHGLYGRPIKVLKFRTMYSGERPRRNQWSWPGLAALLGLQPALAGTGSGAPDRSTASAVLRSGGGSAGGRVVG
ncbi:MAG: sugar transferase, partial [Planctomycetes bacterium]|nr:sugar transferase [Planctomycetota bacterium]